jgi:hypothetical protein
MNTVFGHSDWFNTIFGITPRFLRRGARIYSRNQLIFKKLTFNRAQLSLAYDLLDKSIPN